MMDVPLAWYKEEMQTHNVKAGMKRAAVAFVNTKLPTLYDFYQRIKKRRQRVEIVCGMPIKIPTFSGFWAEPDYFYKYSKYFREISIEMQPFFSKPVIYRKYRFNILMKEKY